MTTAEAETKPAAVANAEVEKKQDTKVEANDGETAKNKRGLHASLGDFASFGHESYAHGGGGGGDFGGHFAGHFGGGGGGGFEGHHGGFEGHHGGFEGHHGGFGGHHGGFEGHHDFAASDHHHEHVKHITVEKKIPV